MARSAIAAVTTLALTLVLGLVAFLPLGEHTDDVGSFLVQGTDVATVAAMVRAEGGTVTHELGIIHAVGAQLTDEQAEALRDRHDLRIHNNGTLDLAGGRVPDTQYPNHIGADRLHAEGVSGAGVTIAVLDSGVSGDSGVMEDSNGKSRLLAGRVIHDGTLFPTNPRDLSGHGTHVASIALSSRTTKQGKYHGIAPDANLVFVSAFDAHGQSTYADVIKGIDWVISNKDEYGIRILNCSFSAPVRSHYWEDPLNQGESF